MSSKHLDPSASKIFMDAIWDCAGEEGVRAVQSAKGGVQVKIPRKAKVGHWLADAIGIDKANAVCRTLWVIDADDKIVPYPVVQIPLGFAGLLARTMADADRRLLEGQPVRKIAVAIGISERAIWRRRANLVQAGKLGRSG